MSILNNFNADGLIFDLDGTLWDSTDVVFEAWKNTIGKIKGIKEPITKELLKSFMGLQDAQIAEKILGFLEEKERLEHLENCGRQEVELLEQKGGVLFPNLEETLKLLSEKYSLFIVSNCNCGYIESFLKYHMMEKYFKDIECPGNTGLSKAENIKLIIERNNLKSPVYIGDTQGDCDSAAKAGIPFVYAGYGFGKVEKYAYKIDHIDDLVDLVAVDSE